MSLLKKPWLMLLMIFIMSWAGVSNASSLPQHQIFKSSNTLTQHHSQQYSTHDQRGCDRHTATQVVQVKSTTPCHTHHHSSSLDDAFQHASSTFIPLFSHQSDCQDCHVFHCQIASSGLLPAVPVLPENIDDLYLENRLISYAPQYLNGYWQRILRPPKA